VALAHSLSECARPSLEAICEYLNRNNDRKVDDENCRAFPDHVTSPRPTRPHVSFLPPCLAPFPSPSSLTIFLLFYCATALNIFFNFRSPAPIVVPIVLLLIAHPLGKFLSRPSRLRFLRLPASSLLSDRRLSSNRTLASPSSHRLVPIKPIRLGVSPTAPRQLSSVSDLHRQSRDDHVVYSIGRFCTFSISPFTLDIPSLHSIPSFSPWTSPSTIAGPFFALVAFALDVVNLTAI
jgi:hypothetical protein